MVGLCWSYKKRVKHAYSIGNRRVCQNMILIVQNHIPQLFIHISFTIHPWFSFLLTVVNQQTIIEMSPHLMGKQQRPCSKPIKTNWTSKSFWFFTFLTGQTNVFRGLGGGGSTTWHMFLLSMIREFAVCFKSHTTRTSEHVLLVKNYESVLTHRGRDKMDAISQTTCSSGFYWMKMFEFRLKFHWSLFLRVQSTIIQHCFR